MAKKIAVVVWACSLGLAAPLLAGAAPDSAPPAATETITEADLKSAVYFLASEEMQGREVNTLFNKITSSYLAHRFELMGLEPVSQDGYFQYYNLLQAELLDGNTLEIRGPDSSRPTTPTVKKDFFPSPLSANGRVSAPLVLAGYGITAPEYGYDDYQKLEVQGKIAVVFDREPGATDPDSPFEGTLDSKYSEELYKIRNAQAHGAAALIIVQDTRARSRAGNFSRHAQFTWPEDSSRARYALKVWEEQIRIPVIHLARELASELLESTGGNLGEIQKTIDEEYQPQGVPLPGVEATLEIAIVRSQIRIRNVLAYLPGSDPVLRDEVVIVSAHFDHVGYHDGEVFYGADDDASGTAGLLEIAEAYALSPERPARSVLFAAWNAEERGLLGSRYYVERPTFLLERTIAMFQMDMIGRNEEIPDPNNPRFLGLQKQSAESNTNSVHVMGYSRSEDLRNLVTQSNERIRLELKFQYDDTPANLLRRSDQWPFLSNDVPVLFFHTGLHPDYHRPTDTPEKINYPKMEKVVRLVFLCSWAAAQSSPPPQLN
jgi:hypothetical protein